MSSYGPLILYNNFAQRNPVTIVGSATITGVAGTVGGDAVYAVNYPWNITNFGVLQGAGTSSVGLDLVSGGSVDNRGSITGAVAGISRPGAVTGAAATIVNSGAITSTGSAGNGVYIGYAGAAAATAAITNLGAIRSTGSSGNGIWLATPGLVVNGSPAVTTAIISGIGGGLTAGGNGPSTVSNYGTIVGSGVTFNGSTYLGARGAYLKHGGEIDNFGAAALIEGYASFGVQIAGGTGTVNNTGTIEGAGVFAKNGVGLGSGGSVVNGSASDTTASITSGRVDGINISGGLGTVTNYGTVSGIRYGIYVAGGTIINRGFVSSGYSLHYGQHNGVRMLSPGGPNRLINSGTINYGAELQNGGSANNSGLINGQLLIIGGAGILTNSGTLAGGVELNSNNPNGPFTTESITNTGQIDNGAFFLFATGILLNAGTVVGSGQTAYFFPGVGPLFPGAAIYDRRGPLTITNLARITSASNGIVFEAGGILTNGTSTGSAAQVSSAGTAVSGATTVTNFGTIGGGTLAVQAATVINHGVIIGTTAVTGASQLVEYPGASLSGTVAGSTLELAMGAGAGTLTGVGTSFVNFGTLTFDPGASWTVGWTPSFMRPAPFPSAVTGFQQGDTIDAQGLVANSYTYTGGVLTLENAGKSVAQITLATPYLDPQFALASDGSGGTDISVSGTIPCFCRGTRVLTAEGEVAVEDLAVGDRVVTLSGAAKPIRWIGMGRDLVTRANKLARPIIVRRGALSEGVPTRDLYLTHGHALYLDGVLIPVENLVNHRSIAWDESARVVEYYHIELEDHDLLLANGAPAESYYDAGNRALFHNTRAGSTPGAAKPTCAPVLSGGAVVEAVWRRIFKRAGGRIITDTTDDPDLHLVVDRRRVEPAAIEDGCYSFALAGPPAGGLVIGSRSSVPSLVDVTAHDHRLLGVAITQIVLQQEGIATWFDYDQPQLREGGCYEHEDGFSWTDGEFHLPARFLPSLAGPFTLTVHTALPGRRYPIAAPAAAAA